LNPNIRIYRYKKGQFFDQHCKFNLHVPVPPTRPDFNVDDDSNNITLLNPGSVPIPAKTTWTLLLYLTSPVTGCMGGDTVFYPDPPAKKGPTPEPIAVGLEVGMALLHKHGKDCMLHEGREVTQGEKWIIRSDLCVRK
jgi:hypothetical protein